MKRKEPTPRGSARECVVLERRIDEYRSMKRRDIESRVSSGDTCSSGSRGLEDKVRTPWFLEIVATSEEDEAHSRGVEVGEEDEGPPSGV
jgi:hypothetical protein